MDTTDPQAPTVVEADEGTLIVDDHELTLTLGPSRVMRIPLDGLRRVQLDIEQGAQPTFVIVPSRPTDRPQVLSLPDGALQDATEAVLRVEAAFRRPTIAEAS